MNNTINTHKPQNNKMPTGFIVASILGFAGMAFLVYLVSIASNEFKWDTNYFPKEKNPFGGYVFYNGLGKHYFEGQKIQKTTTDLTVLVQDSLPRPSNILLVEPSTVIDAGILQGIRALTQQGHNILISTDNISTNLTSEAFNLGEDASPNLNENKDSIPYYQLAQCTQITNCDERFSKLSIENDTVQRAYVVENSQQAFYLQKEFCTNYFKLSQADSLGEIAWEQLGIKVLGKDAQGRPNFIEVHPFPQNAQAHSDSLPVNEGGKREGGKLYVHLTPRAFSNYEQLYSDGIPYTQAILAHLPNLPVYWIDYANIDQRYKPTSEGLLSFILAQPALANAFYLLLFGTGLYIFFTAKRRQRIQEIIKVPQNKSLDFIDTLAQLYLKRDTAHNILRKRINILYEYIREQYQLHPNDANFSLRLAARADLSLTYVTNLITELQQAQQKKKLSQTEWLHVQHLIEDFYAKVRT